VGSPWERIKCACPRLDRHDCADFRSGYDMRRMLASPGDPEYNELDSGEECECACHDEHDAQLSEEE
jgi:hypothetical protein